MIDHTDIAIAIQRIAPFYRQVLHMHYCLNMSYEEIASTLNRPVSQTKLLMYQARRACMQALQKIERESIPS